MKRIKSVIFKLVLVGLSFFFFIISAHASPIHLWNDYQGILSKVLVKGNYSDKYGDYFQHAVDYQKMVSDKSLNKKFNNQNSLLATFDPKDIKNFNKNNQLAFWINAYNYFTLYDIKTHYPIKSMKEIGWKKAKFLVAGKNYSLDNIEHAILRKLNIPEIHFAINCASVSCPSLVKEIFQPQNVLMKMKGLVKNAFKSPIHLQVKKKFFSQQKTIRVSKILAWFADDFGKKEEVLSFIQRYAPSEYQNYSDYTPDLNYNWELNTQENIIAYLRKFKK